MSKEYEMRAPRLIYGVKQWIRGKIRNDDRKNIYNAAFNEFVELLENGENLLNAKRNIQGKYDVPIEYDSNFPKDIYEKSTLIVQVG